MKMSEKQILFYEQDIGKLKRDMKMEISRYVEELGSEKAKTDTLQNFVPHSASDSTALSLSFNTRFRRSTVGL